MRADRFGSYSIDAIRAGTPSLRRLKSMIRYLRLCPPPRNREVVRPWAFRPPDFFSGASRDFSGFVRVISEKSLTDPNRRPGERCRHCQPVQPTTGNHHIEFLAWLAHNAFPHNTCT